MNVKTPYNHSVSVRKLLSMILQTWREKPDCYYHAQLALWVATLAGASNSGVPYGAIRQAHGILTELWNGRVSKKDAQDQLQALTNERRNEDGTG